MCYAHAGVPRLLYSSAGQLSTIDDSETMSFLLFEFI